MTPTKIERKGFIKRGGRIPRGKRLKRATGQITPDKRRKKGELTKLKQELWALTRQLVFKTYGSDCYTSDHKNLEGSNRQGGHVPWHSSELSVACRYDIRYIRPQCFNCNMRKGGLGGAANQRMRREGINVDELEHYNEETKGHPYPLQWFRDRIQEYQAVLSVT